MRRTRAEVEKVLYLDTDDDFMAIWDEQEATIRELSEALEPLLALRSGDRVDTMSVPFIKARIALKRARGAS